MMENIAVVLLALELRVVFPFGKNSRVATTKKKKKQIFVVPSNTQCYNRYFFQCAESQ